jgi:hypothetical protein
MKHLLKPLNQLIGCFLLFLTLGLHTSFGQYLAPSSCLPPFDAVYVGQFHQNFGGIFNLSDPVHSGFTSCVNPPQNIGDSVIHSFGSNVKATVAVTNGPIFKIDAPAQVAVKMKKVGQSGNVSTYATEMITLDIQGGNLPPGFMIRESPTLLSTGTTTIDNTPGGFLIISSFDISTELSTDHGNTWIPSDHPGHMALSYRPGLPTLSQWGLIALVLILTGTALWVLRKGRTDITG